MYERKSARYSYVRTCTATAQLPFALHDIKKVINLYATDFKNYNLRYNSTILFSVIYEILYWPQLSTQLKKYCCHVGFISKVELEVE